MPRISLQIVFTLILFLLPLHGNSESQNSSSNPEQTILLQLKQHWQNPPSISHWTPLSDHCSWPEVNCTDGSVTSISVYNYSISETIPPFICDLKELAVLNLSCNLIPGFFPIVLYNCSKLQSLDLSQNSFVGTIPDDIDRLSPMLEQLNLDGNNFTGAITPAIGKLAGLRSLHLGYNLFNGSFPAEIGDLSSLEDLVLNENGFAPQVIPSSFTRLRNLKNLWMYGTSLIGEIPQDIGNMTSLEYLDLSRNGLNGNIPEGLFQLKNLSTLYLYTNGLSGSIPQSIESLNLGVIDLSNNNLTGNIPDAFGKLNKLTGLALFFNQLSGEIPASIGLLPALEIFRVYSNNLTGQLPPEMGRHSVLRAFEVATNNLVGNLPEGLCANGVLTGVVAFDNDLTGGLPQSLDTCDSLKVVLVSGNRLSGRIPDGLWTATNLLQLMVSDNSLTGQLPDNVSPNLSIFEISNNQFWGEIPAGVSSWNNLRTFKASNNNLSGSIPQELTSLADLNVLFLDGNQFSGSFPSNITSWKGLTQLNCSRNQLSGQIPGAIGLLPVLNVLDLSENDFSGEIPTQNSFKMLNFFNLSSNHLSGEIPAVFQNAVFDRSFLGNPGLCSNDPLLGLNSCISKTGKSNGLSSKFVAVVSSMAAVGFLVALIYTFFVIRMYRNKKHSMDSSWKLTSFHELNFTASTVLSGLTENNMIGSGGSGKVYRVSRPGGYVAVKKIFNSSRLGEKLEKGFLAEVEILGTIRHSNIVKLMCCISTENSKLLVYEYMENRSLDRWLHCNKRSHTTNLNSVHHNILDWPKRHQIAIGAAQGLAYMHHDCSPPIIHRDLKSSNILLDSEFNAKIADFGLARMLVKDGEPNTMSVVAGSFGYIAPEYAKTRRVNEKTDVYSFGVILLELVTGREGNDGDETSSLAEWSWRLFQEGKPIEDAIDEDIKEACYLDEIINVFKLGIFCTGLIPSSRPTTRDILQVLLRGVNPLPIGEKKARKSEYDVAPLLNNSKRERSLMDEDGGLDSIV